MKERGQYKNWIDQPGDKKTKKDKSAGTTTLAETDNGNRIEEGTVGAHEPIEWGRLVIQIPNGNKKEADKVNQHPGPENLELARHGGDESLPNNHTWRRSHLFWTRPQLIKRGAVQHPLCPLLTHSHFGRFTRPFPHAIVHCITA
ncbi:MAG TPA: hypothetical protein VJW77_06025, partial [Terriglobia bacterium]|nr:hypothetical protein [Terriglobia bacterium]